MIKWGAYGFRRWIFNNHYNILDVLPENIRLETENWNKAHPWYDSLFMPWEAYTTFDDYSNMAHQFVNENFAERINYMEPNLRIKAGMKMSRAINKICEYLNISKLPDYNKEFAKFADSINPLKIVRHTILSISPIDYLTMSFGNSWASCHTIDKENKRDMPNSYQGQYSSGTISYMLDKVSMVFYTVDASYHGDEYYFESKINRCMFHYGKDMLIQGRVYPQSNDSNEDGIYKSIREIVQRVMADCLEMPNYWTTKRGVSEIGKYVCTDGTQYPDYTNFNNCCISFPKDKELNESVITIGHMPICIDCGEEHSNSENINHCTANKKECANCGRLYDEDDMYYIDDDWYCDDCTTSCGRCSCRMLNDDATWIESENRNVCEYCRDNNYEHCACCDEYVRDYDINWVDSESHYVCDDCRDNNYGTCDLCDEIFHNDNLTYDAENNSYYCESCWEDVNSEEEEEENEEVC